jgi:hypothetical protein
MHPQHGNTAVSNMAGYQSTHAMFIRNPAPLVAEMLCYRYQVTQRDDAEEAGTTWPKNVK